MSRFEEMALKTIAIVLVPLVAGLALYVQILWRDYTDTNAVTNGYVAPKYVYSLIEETRKATVTVECSDYSASGFSFAFEDEDEASFSFDWSDPKNTSIILTNFHVVEVCYEKGSEILVQDSNMETLRAQIVGLDKENDLAALFVARKIPELKAAYYVFRPGYWVMATGSPYGMFGTTTFGNIIYSEGYRIYTSASLNRGNSGGPLVDNLGYVMAINTGYKAVAQNLNFAIDINALCKKLAKCFAESKLIHPDKDYEE